MRKIVYFLLFFIICTLSVMFFVQNNQSVTVSFFVGQQDISLAFIMVGAVFIGYLLGVITLSTTVIRQNLKLKQNNRHMEHQSKEIENLRSMPVRDKF